MFLLCNQREEQIPLGLRPIESFNWAWKVINKDLKIPNKLARYRVFLENATQGGQNSSHIQGLSLGEYLLSNSKYTLILFISEEFEMFQDFSEKKFLKSYSEMFDDQLELKELNILRKQRVKTIGNAVP